LASSQGVRQQEFNHAPQQSPYGCGMTSEAAPDPGPVRTAEVAAVACLATDLGMGFPFEQGLRTTLVALRLIDLLDVDAETARHTYYVSLLSYAGCTTDAAETAAIFGQSLTANLAPAERGSQFEAFRGVVKALPPPDLPALRGAWEVARRLPQAGRFQKPHFVASCEVASMLAERLGISSEASGQLAFMTERWDGKGVLGRAARDAIPLPVRVVQAARDTCLQASIGGPDHATRSLRERAGGGFDPEIAHCLADHADTILAEVNRPGSVMTEVLSSEPGPRLSLAPAAVDRALAALGNFADLVSPWLAGHSEGVARLAAAAARECGLGSDDARMLLRAGHVHDVGRVAVHPAVWGKSDPLTADEWEQVRLHPYHSERVLAASDSFAPLAPLASCHHERLDGTGYHRGMRGGMLTPAARLLGAADAFHTLTEPRPHRAAMRPARVAERLADDAEDGKQDPDAVAAVIAAADEQVPAIERPSGLTDREAQVVGLVARGLQTKEIAKALGMAVKTADNHIQRAYAKLGVSSRAAATLVAMEQGLVTWDDLPGRPSRTAT